MNATPKALWAAIVVLALAVMGLGGTLLWQQRSAGGAAAPPAASRMAQPTPLDGQPAAPRGPVRAPDGQPPPVPQAPAPVPQAPAPAQPAPSQLTPQPAPQVRPPARLAQPPVRAPSSAGSACTTCGQVQSVTTVRRSVGGAPGGSVTRYQVTVRMHDGRLRKVETRSAPPIGKAVTLRQGVLRPADGRP